MNLLLIPFVSTFNKTKKHISIFLPINIFVIQLEIKEEE